MDCNWLINHSLAIFFSTFLHHPPSSLFFATDRSIEIGLTTLPASFFDQSQLADRPRPCHLPALFCVTHQSINQSITTGQLTTALPPSCSFFGAIN